jgi:molybdopterin converting factor small subunit
MENKIPHLIKLFGPLIDITSSSAVQVYGDTIAELREDFIRQWPDAARYQWATAVNQTWISEAQTLRPGDEIAFLPPFSGG